MAYGTVTSHQADETSTAPRNMAQTEDPDRPVEVADSTRSIWERMRSFYDANIGLFFVFLAQLFGSIMSLTTRLLETGFDTKFHALQIVFVRMLATGIIGSVYLWWKQAPGFPLGAPGIRWLLIIRGMAGTSGLISSYYALSILDISDATVISFLVPTLTAIVCWVVLREPFTPKEAFASAIAFVGVLFVARPSFLFPSSSSRPPVLLSSGPEVDNSVLTFDNTGGIITPVPVTPEQRSLAVICAVWGSFSAAAAYATIRVIGKRAHSLVSVNYFAVTATVVSFLALVLHPDLSFQVPQTLAQWILLCFIGISGFLLQVLLTEGLQREKAGRATNLIYVQLVFALIFERIIWGTTPPVESFVGSALIIGAALLTSLQRTASAAPKPAQGPDEESRLLGQQDDDDRERV